MTTRIVNQSLENQYLITPDSAVLQFMMEKGQSFIEPQDSPKENVHLSYVTWEEFEEECGMSRVWGGVNFKDTVIVSKTFGKQFAADAVSFVKRKVTSGFKDYSDDNYYYGKTLWPPLIFV